MKICKNCGRQTDDNKVRCPHCGYLFEEDMDAVLSKMKENLNTYKNAVTAAPAAAQQQQPQQQLQQQQQPPLPAPQQEIYANGASALPAAADPQRERFELLSEVAQLKGELKALHSQIDRMQAYPSQPPAAQNTAYIQPPVQPQTVIYAQPYPQQGAAPQAYPQPYAAPQAKQETDAAVRAKKPRSANRIVISLFCILLVALSIFVFFRTWVEWTADSVKASFQGFDAVMYLIDKDSEAAGRFAQYLAVIDNFEFIGNETIAGVCRAFCKYVVQYGVAVYAGLLVLGFPLLFSLFGRVRFRAWHRFFAWTSFIAALLLFGIFCWVSGFSAITLWFLVGAGANFVRCLFLIFFKGKKKSKGGLES